MDGKDSYRDKWQLPHPKKKKNKREKNEVMFSRIMKQDQEAKNVILSGKDACRRSIAFS